MTREIARRFNNKYGEVFPEPQGLVGRIARLPGTDGESKMSKSIDNAIFLSDDSETVIKKVRSMYTDPTRIRATDPGHVEGNPVFAYHDAFNTDTDEVDELKERYRAGTVGDVEVKKRLANALNIFLDPIRDQRASFEQRDGFVQEVLVEGSRRAQKIASLTMEEVREKMGLLYLNNR